MKTIHHVCDTTAPRDTVFAALTTTQGLSRWRTTIVKAEAGAGAIAPLTFAGDFNDALVRRFTEEFKNRNNLAVAGHAPEKA